MWSSATPPPPAIPAQSSGANTTPTATRTGAGGEKEWKEISLTRLVEGIKWAIFLCKSSYLRSHPLESRLAFNQFSTCQAQCWIFYKLSATKFKNIQFMVLSKHNLGFHLLCVHARSLQSCLTLCDSTDYSLPGPSVHRILQARILEWVALPFSRRSSRPRDRTHVS